MPMSFRLASTASANPARAASRPPRSNRPWQCGAENSGGPTNDARARSPAPGRPRKTPRMTSAIASSCAGLRVENLATQANAASPSSRQPLTTRRIAFPIRRRDFRPPVIHAAGNERRMASQPEPARIKARPRADQQTHRRAGVLHRRTHSRRGWSRTSPSSRPPETPLPTRTARAGASRVETSKS